MLMAHNNLGLRLASSNRWSEAAEHFEQAVRLKPDYDQAHTNLGMALERLPGRDTDALAHFQQALRLKPDSINGHNNLGVWYVTHGQPAMALHYFEAASKLDSTNVSVQRNLKMLRENWPQH